MALPRVSEAKIVDLIKRGLTASQICNEVNFASSGSWTRITRVAKKHGLTVNKAIPARMIAEDDKQHRREFEEKLRHNARKQIQIYNGIVIVGSDAHYWPGIVSTAHRAFLKFARELRPSAVILNGDGFDGATISRFPRIGWDTRPTVLDELQTCITRLGEIEEAAGTKNLYWPLGNHDARYETFLASRVPEFQGVDGFHLKDKFPLWAPCWSVFINDNTVVKHRFKTGIHAPHNNTMWAGRSIVTGHLHSMKVMPISDYGGTRYGVDSGCLADPGGPQFVDYTEDNPLSWRSGFAVLTYHKGRLLWPEFVHVLSDGEVEFRGHVFSV